MKTFDERGIDFGILTGRGLAASRMLRLHGGTRLWDNRCTQHRVVADALPSYRRMERVTLIGDEPR